MSMRIALTVLGGFLGAGKTTLLNRCLREAPPGTAVLVNDFGALQIDADLIASRDADTIALSNGCVCCQIGDDLTRSLSQVLSRQPAPAWVIIEASGVSDPWRIAQVGLVTPELTLDGVIVVLDAATLRERAQDPLLADTVLRQLHAADVLVLNQMDRLPVPDHAPLRAWLKTQLRAGDPQGVPAAGAVPVFETSHADLPWQALTGVHQAWPTQPAGDPHASQAQATGPDGSAPYLAQRLAPVQHEAQFQSWSGTWVQPLDAQALRQLLRAMPPGVLRLKGIVRTDRHACAELQFAGRHGSLRGLVPPVGWDGCSRVVAIGLQGALPADHLARALDGAALDSGDDR